MLHNVLSQHELKLVMIDQLESGLTVGLVGIPGSGKSYACAEVGKYWTEKGDVTLVARGDQYQKSRRNFPFYDAIGQALINNQALVKSIQGVIAKGASAIPIAGPIAAFVIDRFFTHSVESAKNALPFLSPEEQTILSDLRRISGQRKLLVICDDLQFWDESSLALLRMILSGKLNATYPFLSGTRWLIVQMVSTSEESPLIEFSSLTVGANETHRVGYATKAEFGAVLKLLNFREDFPESLVSDLYSICGGHLHVTKQLVSYLAETDSQFSDEWAKTKGADFLASLVTARLKEIGPQGVELFEVLKAASIIGNIFSEQEIACLRSCSPESIRKSLAQGERLNLVQKGVASFQFSHAIVHESVRVIVDPLSQELHSQFAACLQKLRPGDYRSRFMHLNAANKRREASAMAFCSLLQDKRKAVVETDNRELRDAIEEFGFSSFFDTVCRAQESLDRYELTNAISLLKHVDPTLPQQIQAEAAYILAIAWIKMYQFDMREKAIDCLKSSIAGLQDEEELLIRLMSTEYVATVHQRGERDSFAIEKELVHKLSLRSKFDPDALDALRVIDRKADLLYSADQSYGRLLRSKHHFSPHGDNSPRNEFQYCASTLNLAANRIVCGEYVEARKYLVEIVSFLEINPLHQFTRFEVLSNNLIISELLSGMSTAVNAGINFEALCNRVSETLDFALIRSNYGSIVALTGDLPKAKFILAITSQELVLESESDYLHRYLVGSNLACVKYLMGEKSTGLNEMVSLEKIVDIAMPPHRHFFRRRHDLLVEAMKSEVGFNVTDWNELPTKIDPSGLGPPWKHYGKGFLLTDLQIFSES
jgi:hypothetical protein